MDFGKIEYIPLGQGKGGRKLSLTLIGQGDSGILRGEGLASLRKKRLLRLVREAGSQDMLLSYEDLAALLMTSVSTLKRDIGEIEGKGHRVPLKGRRRQGGLGRGLEGGQEGVAGHV